MYGYEWRHDVRFFDAVRRERKHDPKEPKKFDLVMNEMARNEPVEWKDFKAAYNFIRNRLCDFDIPEIVKPLDFNREYFYLNQDKAKKAIEHIIGKELEVI